MQGAEPQVMVWLGLRPGVFHGECLASDEYRRQNNGECDESFHSGWFTIRGHNTYFRIMEGDKY
jgi:hypothetical protein